MKDDPLLRLNLSSYPQCQVLGSIALLHLSVWLQIRCYGREKYGLLPYPRGVGWSSRLVKWTCKDKKTRKSDTFHKKYTLERAFKGIVPQFFCLSNLIFWIVLGCGNVVLFVLLGGTSKPPKLEMFVPDFVPRSFEWQRHEGPGMATQGPWLAAHCAPSFKVPAPSFEVPCAPLFEVPCALPFETPGDKIWDQHFQV